MTGINGENNIEVDGMPRHILDLRRMVIGENSDGEDNDEGVNPEPGEIHLRRSQRQRRPPA